MSNFLGGLAAAYKGYQQGQDQELARQQLAKDRDQADKDRLFQQGQRDFAQGQQARTLRTQAEDDVLNDKQKSIALDREVGVSPAVVGNNPSAAQPAATRRVARTNDDLYAEQAKNLLAAGKWEKASQLQAASDQIKMKRHAGMFQELDGAWAGRAPKTPEETKALVEDVKRIFNGDPMAGDIQDYSIGADGMVTMTALNKSTGQSSTKTMAPTQMLDYMRAYYAPESQAKLLADKRAHEYKMAQEKAKQEGEVKVLNPGDRLGSVASGVTANNNEPASVLAARARAGGMGGVGKPFKMDEDDKLLLLESNKHVMEAERALTDATKNLQPGEDPTKFPGVMQAQNMLRQARGNQFKTKVRLGQVTPEQVVVDIMGAAKTQADVIKSLNELGGTVGTEFADQVGALVSSNDGWKAMTAGQPSPAKTTNGQVAAPDKPAAQTAPQAIEPRDRGERLQLQDALLQGYDPVGRGNGGVFGGDEILYKNRKTGETAWASKLFGK